jgi:hypothetical protein
VAVQTGAAPKDFALRLIGGSCLVDAIDTFRGRYSRDLGEGKHASVRFSLSVKQKSDLFQRIQDASFFSYPSKYSPSGLVIQEPGGFSRLTVQTNGARHTVRLDSVITEDPEAARFKTVLADIWEFFDRLPAVKRLPSPPYLCL